MTKVFQTYYIPGYPGKNSETAKKLMELNPDMVVLEYEPTEDPWVTVSRMVDRTLHTPSHPIIVASSLGGWFAENVASRIPCDLILWNPSLTPNLIKYGVNTPYIPLLEVHEATPRTVFLGDLDTVVYMQYAQTMYKDIADVRVLNVDHKMTEDGLRMVNQSIKDHQCFLSENT